MPLLHTWFPCCPDSEEAPFALPEDLLFPEEHLLPPRRDFLQRRELSVLLLIQEYFQILWKHQIPEMDWRSFLPAIYRQDSLPRSQIPEESEVRVQYFGFCAGAYAAFWIWKQHGKAFFFLFFQSLFL